MDNRYFCWVVCYSNSIVWVLFGINSCFFGFFNFDINSIRVFGIFSINSEDSRFICNVIF